MKRSFDDIDENEDNKLVNDLKENCKALEKKIKVLEKQLNKVKKDGIIFCDDCECYHKFFKCRNCEFQGCFESKDKFPFYCSWNCKLVDEHHNE